VEPAIVHQLAQAAHLGLAGLLEGEAVDDQALRAEDVLLDQVLQPLLELRGLKEPVLRS